MINTLLNARVIDNLSMAMSSLKQNYIIDNSPCNKYNDLKKIKDTVSNDINTLKSLIYYIDRAITSINEDIANTEREE